jgi:hypothetical protein
MAGCVSIKPPHVIRDTSQVTHHASRVTKFTPPDASHLYKATVDIKKHHLTGLLVIKRMDTITPALSPSPKVKENFSGTYRIVFMNEVGMTFFDLEMQPDGFKVVSCFSSMNKKALINILETDFRMLIGSGPLQSGKIYRQSGTNNMVEAGHSGKYKTWQTYSPAGDTLFSTAAKSNIADPVFICFDQFRDGFPGKITFQNPVIGMKLSLRKLAK